MSETIKRFAALKTSLFLSLLFLVVYGGTNWLAPHRANVGSLFFEWERHIPFVPLMVIPYLSIDLFFVAAPFVCRDEHELNILRRRVTLAILVAGLCFLLFPLRFAFERPAVTGWLSGIFSTFRSLDRPYNLVPSLHITFQIILGLLYARHTTGLLRFASIIWFALIGLATVLTYQHHVLDVLGGLALAGYCLYVFPGSALLGEATGNPRIGVYYAGASILVVILAACWQPWGFLLVWPALSLAIVAGAYLRLGPGIFRKANGRVPWSTLFALGPCLFGQWFSLLYYRRQCRAWNEVAAGVLLGRKLEDREAAEAIESGVTAVLDLTAEFSEARSFRALEYLNIPILDLTAPTQLQMENMARFIASHAETGKVYVHCKVGYSRSAAAVGAWLLASRQTANAAETLELLRRVRPSIIVRPEVIEALALFADRHHSSRESLIERTASSQITCK